MWVSLVITASSLIAPAVTLTMTALFYIIALCKKEEFTRSKVGGSGMAAAAAASAFV